MSIFSDTVCLDLIGTDSRKRTSESKKGFRWVLAFASMIGFVYAWQEYEWYVVHVKEYLGHWSVLALIMATSLGRTYLSICSSLLIGNQAIFGKATVATVLSHMELGKRFDS